jgi:hypothetical protein
VLLYPKYFIMYSIIIKSIPLYNHNTITITKKFNMNSMQSSNI